MSVNSNMLVIGNTSVRRDSEGRYCLNDLHKAAGGDAKHQPALFMRLDSTKALIAELENSTEVQSLTTGIPVVTVEGRNGGTYVAKELVYAYAMWISPAFHLKVIRAYDALATGHDKPLPALQKPSIKDHLLFAREIAKVLRLSETSKIRMYQVIAEETGITKKMLPAYSDETLTRPIGDLLKDHGSDLTAVRCNPILHEMGYLEQLSRKKKDGSTKNFWSVTEQGFKYGKNETPPENPRETQPRWYVSTFPKLLAEINAHINSTNSANDSSVNEAA